MKTVVRHAVRFFLWWMMLFLSAHIVTIFAVSATLVLDPTNRWYGWGATVALPVLGVLYAQAFFRRVDALTLAEVLELGLVWAGLYMGASSLLGPFFYGIPWQAEFTDPGSLAVDTLIFLGFFFVGYRRCVRGSVAQPLNLLEETETQTPSVGGSGGGS